MVVPFGFMSQILADGVMRIDLFGLSQGVFLLDVFTFLLINATHGFFGGAIQGLSLGY